MAHNTSDDDEIWAVFIFFGFMPVIAKMIFRITMHFLLHVFLFAYFESEEHKLYVFHVL